MATALLGGSSARSQPANTTSNSGAGASSSSTSVKSVTEYAARSTDPV